MIQVGKRYIFVMERGFVLIGSVTATDHEHDPALAWLASCGVVRVWGTDQGLGQLASGGLRKKTVVDWEPDGTVIRLGAVYRAIPCLGSESSTRTKR